MENIAAIMMTAVAKGPACIPTTLLLPIAKGFFSRRIAIYSHSFRVSFKYDFKAEQSNFSKERKKLTITTAKFFEYFNSYTWRMLKKYVLHYHIVYSETSEKNEKPKPKSSLIT